MCIIEQIILNTKDILDYISTSGTFLVGFITLIVIATQLYIQRHQHNLCLFEKRWKLFKEFQKMGYEAETWPRVSPEDIDKHPEQNWRLMHHRLKLFSEQCAILFNEQVTKKTKRITELFEEKQKINEKLSIWRKYHKSHKEQYPQEQGNDLSKRYLETDAVFMNKLDELYGEILTFLKEEKVN